jgi:threonine dehydratase
MIRPTTFISSLRLNQAVGTQVLIASETFQHSGNFKFRAAWYLVTHVPQKHLLTASSGNFGQALAMACQTVQKKCTVVMPSTAALVKVQAVREFGGYVEFSNGAPVSIADRIAQLTTRYPQAYVADSAEDKLVIEGNSTLGVELAQKARDFDVVVVPIGGGGLAAGIITGLRSKHASIRVIGAEPLLANDAARSFRAGRLIRDSCDCEATAKCFTIAEGARGHLGVRTWEIIKDGLSDIIEVPEAEIRQAVRLLFHLANLKVEPTGALAVAAVLTTMHEFRNCRVCCVVTGGNVDPEVYCSMVE